MIKYRFNLLEALNQAGYNTTRIRKEKLIPEATLQNMRKSKPISLTTLDTLCRLLDCQPGDILIYEKEPEQ